MRKPSSKLQLGLGLGISVVCLYLALRNVDLEEVQKAILNADPFYISLALMSIAFNNLAKSARWKVLLGIAGQKTSNIKILMAFLAGQMINFLLPARVGEMSRVYLVGRMGLGHAFVAGTLVIEKALDMLAYGLLFLVLLAAIPLPDWIQGSGYSFIILSLFLMIALGGAVHWRGKLEALFERLLKKTPPGWRRSLLAWLINGLESLENLRDPGALLKLTLITAFTWGTALWTNQLTLQALDIHLPLTASLLVLIALQAGISVPSVPGKIGLFQIVCVLGLAVFGIAKSQALSYGILLYVIVFFPTTLTGLVSAWLLSLGENNASQV